MFKYRLLISFVVLIIFSSGSFCFAEVGQGGAVSPPSAKILKMVGIVKNITPGTLILDNNKKYDLSRAKVKYDTGKPKPNKKQKAEMYFVNDVLKEVTIYY